MVLIVQAHPLWGQTCLSDAGADTTVCTGEGSQYRVYLDGSDSNVENGNINYEWTVLDEGITISSSQSDEVDPYFKYPQDLMESSDFRIELRVYDDDGICEDRDTIIVTCFANMCPTAVAGEDQELSNGCIPSVTLDGTETEDPEGDALTFQWSSQNGYDSYIQNANSPVATFTFPEIDADKIFSFMLYVSDDAHTVSDVVRINYLDNEAPVADAGLDLETCDYQFSLSGNQSYDADWNELTYSWTSLDGLDLSGTSTATPLVTSPTDLTTSAIYRVQLDVYDGYCTNTDTVLITIQNNLCPSADAGGTVRVAKFDPRPVVLSAAGSWDPEGSALLYEWEAPSGEIIAESMVTVVDELPNTRYTRYVYYLRVMDEEGAVDQDSVEVIFSEFSAPLSPQVFAVADHNRALISWDAASEASYDSLTGYSDFEGYKLYRSTDGGETWGGPNDRLYDYNGDFVGWIPYAQFDYSYDEDFFHCIYEHESCESGELLRGTSIAGLDPLAPRFSLGTNSGIEYSFIDSSVVDGIEYTYTVTAYDIGLSPFQVSFSETDTSGIYESDTIWSPLNPGHFLGPETLTYYDGDGQFLRLAANPDRGFLSLESNKGSSGDHNFITVMPGYTASNITFPSENDIEALFTSNETNIGTGDRKYFIVDRTKIISSRLHYEIQAQQSSQAVDEMACEDPYVYAYEINQENQPVSTISFYANDLSFFEKDSLSDLPGAVVDGDTYVIPKYEIITAADRWSEQFKGIRFKYDNALPLNVSAVPAFEIDTLLWSLRDGTELELDSILFGGYLDAYLFLNMAYTNIVSYNRRLNFNYKIEFFSEPVGDTIGVTNANGEGLMGIPFRITNLWTGKKIGLTCNDFGHNNSNPIDFENGASDFTWTRNELLKLRYDSLKVAGTWIEASNYELQLDWFVPPNVNRLQFNASKEYFAGDTVYFKQMLWSAHGPVAFGTEPDPRTVDEDNPWLPVYPWSDGLVVTISPQKFFVDGDNWVSDMSILGAVQDVVDTTLNEIRVVPNPYMVHSKFNETPLQHKLRFTRLPQRCQITIYTVAGEVVTSFQHENEFDGNAWWDLTNSHGQLIGPGLYIYVVESDNNKEIIGKFAVIR